MRGSCLCGAIEYEVSQLDSPIEHCSCRFCRKAHAAAFNTVPWLRYGLDITAYPKWEPGHR
jgi:ADP-ribosyl-[dinitrogen reductase] hydrolase